MRVIHDIRGLVPILPIVQEDLEIRTDADKVVSIRSVFDVLYKLGVFPNCLLPCDISSVYHLFQLGEIVVGAP